MTSTAAKKASLPYLPNRSGGKDGSSSRCGGCFQLLLLISSFVWILAVIKVFLLEKFYIVVPNSVSNVAPNPNPQLLNGLPSSNYQSKFEIKSKLFAKSTLSQTQNSVSKSKSNDAYMPRAREWLLTRSHQAGTAYNAGNGKDIHGILLGSKSPEINYKQISVQSKVEAVDASSAHQHEQWGVHTDKDVEKNKWHKSHELKWPPLTESGDIPGEDGYEEMPLTKLKVPRFWYPEQGVDWNKSGRRVNGKETIYLMIASYRDFQCRETIASAFKKADHPDRLFVGAVDQVSPGDIGCLDLEVSCDQDPSQMICKYKHQISVYKMDASYATGPVTARHIGDRMYRGEYYTMQMDAHCLFANHWDTNIIKQFTQTHNEMAVLTSYMTDIQGSLDAHGDSTRNTRPIMCNSYFEGVEPQRYLRHGSQPEDVAVVRDMPQLQPFWAAGLSFSRGHFKLRVPYDAYQPMVFQGEEIAIGIRGFTHGYDYYAPRDSVVFHEYAERSSRRKKIHMFWENSPAHKGEGQKSLKRSMVVVGMARGTIDPESWDHSEIDKYGLGKVRTLKMFYDTFLIDVPAGQAVQLCPFVRGGAMHKQFQPHLSKDGLGINYAELMNFPTLHYVPGELVSKRY